MRHQLIDFAGTVQLAVAGVQMKMDKRFLFHGAVHRT
jgi:hypothetical protein